MGLTSMETAEREMMDELMAIPGAKAAAEAANAVTAYNITAAARGKHEMVSMRAGS